MKIDAFYSVLKVAAASFFMGCAVHMGIITVAFVVAYANGILPKNEVAFFSTIITAIGCTASSLIMGTKLGGGIVRRFLRMFNKNKL